MASSITPMFLNLQYTIPFLLCLPPLFLLFHQLRKANKKKLPPSPRKLPIIGNLHQVGSLPHHSLQALARKHGDVILLHLGSTPTLVVSSSEAASEVLKAHDLVFCSRPHWSLFTRLFNNGMDVIAAPYGDYWRHMRSICVLQLLSTKRVQSFRSVREDEVALMLHKIKQLSSSSSSSSSVINMRDVFLSLSNDLISRVALGSSSNKHGVDFPKLVGEMSELMGRFSIGDFIPWLSWISRFSGDYARANKLTKALDDFLGSVIAEHSSYSINVDEDGGAAKDFVNVLLDLQNGNGTDSDHITTTQRMPFDTDSIKGLLPDMFAGGTETTSIVLEWMMSEILMAPPVMERLKQEVKKVVDSTGKEAITEDELKHMVYLKAAIQETLRLHPPLPILLPRESARDVKIEGYDISAGTLVFVNCWAIGRDPRYWDDPESFHPERFMDSDSTTWDRGLRMIPFGYGRRGCPGESFALVSMELAMANLLLRFDWKLPLGREKESLEFRKEHPGITTKRATPLLAVATPTFLR